MNVAYSRSERVAHLIQREVARIILCQVRDPRLRSVTLTKVKLSADLRVARIFVSSIDGSKERDLVLQGLGRARRFIRGRLGDSLQLRVTPEIVFRWDDSVEYSFHIARRLADLEGQITPGEEKEDE